MSARELKQWREEWKSQEFPASPSPSPLGRGRKARQSLARTRRLNLSKAGRRHSLSPKVRENKNSGVQKVLIRPNASDE
jgi:hypothetical protein